MQSGLTLYQFSTRMKNVHLFNEMNYPKLFIVDDHEYLVAVKSPLFEDYKKGYEFLKKETKTLAERNNGSPGRNCTKEIKNLPFNSCYSLHILSKKKKDHIHVCRIFRKSSGSINNIVGTSAEARDVCDEIERIVNKANPDIGLEIYNIRVSLHNIRKTIDIQKYSNRIIPHCPINANKRNYRGPYCSLVINIHQLRKYLSDDDFFKITIDGVKYPCLIFYGEINNLQFVYWKDGVTLRVKIQYNGKIDIKGSKSSGPAAATIEFIEKIIEKYSDELITVGIRTVQIGEMNKISKLKIDEEFVEDLERNLINPKKIVPCLTK